MKPALPKPEEADSQKDCGKPDDYEAPCIESIVTAEQIQREIYYAGDLSIQPPA